MITFDLTQETPTSATGVIVEPEGETNRGTLSFSDLLKGIKEGDTMSETGVLLLSLENDGEQENSLANKAGDGTALQTSKNTLLTSLLNGDTSNIDEMDLLELNPEIESSLSSDELKQLVQDAKTYLKEQIVTSDGFKRSEVEKLPKTLQGLADAAKKIGIDISKISVEEVKSNPQSTSLNESKKQTFNSTNVNQNEISDTTQRDEQKKNEQRALSKEINSSPLFKEQKNRAISTEQIVNAKAVNSNPSSDMQISKKRTDDTLKLLLRGEESAKSEGSTFTKDFSVATAKVIAPIATNESAKSLESLLNPQTVSDDETSDVKLEGTTVAKADSFEVKLNEAKQMIKYLSQDVKQAIDDYKSPFTRVKVQLNPQELGDVELTVVQRGKNLHVNLSSNNAAINTLAMNANDLKVQLENSGINNASLNFSNNSQGESASQQQQQNREDAQNEYNYFENEEANEEILSSLEIVVPNYA